MRREIPKIGPCGKCGVEMVLIAGSLDPIQMKPVHEDEGIPGKFYDHVAVRKVPEDVAHIGKIIGVDMDGVLASYRGKYDPDHIGAPMDGACEWIEHLLAEGFHVVIFTSRRTEDVFKWLVNWHFPIPATTLHLADPDLPKGVRSQIHKNIYINHYPTNGKHNPGKPPFFLHVDDRAATFRGKFEDFSAVKIREFRPWWNK